MLLVCRQPLLTNEKTQQDALLAVSSLVNNYCESSAGCAEDEEVQKVLDSLTGILGKDCDVNDSNFKQVSTHRLCQVIKVCKIHPFMPDFIVDNTDSKRIPVLANTCGSFL